jgi:hypothetical protein
MVVKSCAPLGKTGVEGETQATGRNPTDRGKSGSKRHLLTEGKGVPLAVVLSGANRHDMKKLADLLDAIVIERPDPEAVEQHLCLDRGYDYEDCRSQAEDRGYVPHIPDTSQPVPPPDDPNRHPPRRWVVSATGILGSIDFGACSFVGTKTQSAIWEKSIWLPL